MLAKTMLAAKPPPRTCDTFVYDAGHGGPTCTRFGKNSDKPAEEEHEVVVFPAATHAAGATVRCTHIAIPQASSTLAVVLSRPAWLWGCEMGANECGVVGGNEAVSTLAHAAYTSVRRLCPRSLPLPAVPCTPAPCASAACCPAHAS